MERPGPDKKPDKEEKGELTIRYQSDTPPDPDSAAIQFAKEIAEEGEDVEVDVHPRDAEQENNDSSE